MATARSRRSYAKLSKTRKLLRKLPDDMVQPIRNAFSQGAEDIAAEAKFNVLSAGLVQSGDMHRHIKSKIGRDGFSAKIGLLTKRARRDAWYAHFLEFGTKGSPARNIPPLPAYAFMGRAFDAHRDELNRNVRREVNRALGRAARGDHAKTTFRRLSDGTQADLGVE